MNNQNIANVEILKQQILDLIECIYSKQFINRLDLTVNKFPDNSNKVYNLKMYLHDLRNAPLSISFEGENDDEFLLFIYEEIRSRNLIRSDRAKILLYD